MLCTRSPPVDPPVVDIKLNQNQNQFFFPGSTVSGCVMFGNYKRKEEFELYIYLFGVNKATLAGSPMESSDQATLFEYSHRCTPGALLHEWDFKFRFPSATDNRSFVQPRDVGVSQSWCNAGHELPPSFDFEIDDAPMRCSVEYGLRAEIYRHKKLMAKTALPIMFLPFQTSAQSLRSSMSYFPGMGYLSNRTLSATRRDSVVEVVDEMRYKMSVETPEVMVIGKKFDIKILVELDDSDFRDQHALLDSNIRINKLELVSTTSCRAFGPHGNGSSVAHSEEQQSSDKIIRLHPQRIATTGAANELQYSFEAIMPSFYSPSFRSFLISNAYRFQSPVVAEVDGMEIELPLNAPDVTVLSSVPQSNGLRRPSTMAVNGRHASLGYGQALTCQT
jgi:hypothetical protein